MSLTMQFKKYRWPMNPSEITVSYDRNLREKVVPLKGSLLQDMGRKKRIVTGKGCFLGEDSLKQFRRLAQVFEEGGAGTLSMPGFPPFLAVFSSLKLNALGRPEETHYSFSFTEADNPFLEEKETIYVCKEKDSLWRVQAETGIPMEIWLEQNRIPWINDLEEGKILQAGRTAE